jgi:hypothetical protein
MERNMKGMKTEEKRKTEGKLAENKDYLLDLMFTNTAVLRC